jgi:hypothetical protein
LAGEILRFPVTAARGGPTAPRSAAGGCVVLPLRDPAGRLPGIARNRFRAVRAEGRDVDALLVDLLRDSVARGEYRVDARRIARKLIATQGL